MPEPDPLVIVSADTHAGPLLNEQLRAYCPKKHLAAFDDYVARDAAYREVLQAHSPQNYVTGPDGTIQRSFHNSNTAGHYDMETRLWDLDYDGVAAEVIFHASINDEPIPFANMGDPRVSTVFKNNAPEDPELAAVGRHMYNEWLVDFCSLEPERHAGLAQIPIWDVDASVREIEWAREAGLRGVNFPAPQSWLPQYNKPVWERLWSAAESLEMPLTTHFGAGSDADYTGVDGAACLAFESVMIHGRRMLPWIIYSGVFARHPNLKLVVTEIPGQWWAPMMEALDSTHRYLGKQPSANSRPEVLLTDVCPKTPSEYCRTNVFMGASFMNHIEAVAASEEGFWTNTMWGSDYPHPEGTFHLPDNWDETPVTHIALRFAFEGIPEDRARAMLGETAIGVYGLDANALKGVATRINAPTLEQINEPFEIPEADRVKSLAFRERSMWD